MEKLLTEISVIDAGPVVGHGFMTEQKAEDLI
jgi:hypothetical protein